MIIRRIDKNIIHDIGHAFAYYDYGDEKGIATAFPDKDAAALYIFGYARGMLNGGFMRTMSGRGEGFIETDAMRRSTDMYTSEWSSPGRGTSGSTGSSTI